MRVISSQITFKRESIIRNNIKFDENFGAGAKYDRAEEAIMLCDALRKKMKIIYVNELIGTVKQEDSTWWSKGFNKEFFIKQGACFYRMNRPIYMLLIIQFAIRKYKLYCNNIKMKEAFCSMIKGAIEYKNECKNDKEIRI